MGSAASFEIINSEINDEYLVNIVNSHYYDQIFLDKDWEGIELELEEFTFSAFDEAIRSIDDEKDVGIILSYDAMGLDSLSPLALIMNHEEFHHVRELRISNNNLNDDSFLTINNGSNDNSDKNYDIDDVDHKVKKLSKISKLSIGGNPITSLLNINTSIANSAYLPRFLLELDCSYCYEVEIVSGSFLSLPQLKRLILDGCGLHSTFSASEHDEDSVLVKEGHEQQSGEQPEDASNNDNNNSIRKMALKYCESNENSIFAGLIQLEYLSLKENNLINLEDMKGLKYFFRFNTLLSLYIEDNEVCQDKSSLDALESFLCTTTTTTTTTATTTTTTTTATTINSNSNDSSKGRDISIGLSSLQCIDNRLVNESKIVAKNKIAQGISHIQLHRDNGGNNSNDIRSAGDVDVLEQDYLAALKGEQDSTVVS